MRRWAVVLSCAVVSCGSPPEDDSLPRPRRDQGLIDPKGDHPEGFESISIIIRPVFPDQATLSKTKNMIVVLRERIEGGASCVDLWSMRPGLVREGVATFAWPQTTASKALAPFEEGALIMLFYAFAVEVHTCQTRHWCDAWGLTANTCEIVAGGYELCAAEGMAPEPIAGGCVETDLKKGTTSDLRVMLAAP